MEGGILKMREMTEHLAGVVHSLDNIIASISVLEAEILKMRALDTDGLASDLIVSKMKEKEVLMRIYEVWSYFIGNPGAYFYIMERLIENGGDVEVGELGVATIKMADSFEKLIKEWKEIDGQGDTASDSPPQKVS